MFEKFTGEEYVKMDIATHHDKAYEKETWQSRLAHFAELDLEDPLTISEASNPLATQAAIDAYNDFNKGIPSGFMISLDACSSGLQLLSLLSSCKKSFMLCGGDSTHCTSAYKLIYDAMDIGDKLDAKTVKNTIMTSFYGSTAMPENVFGDDLELFYSTIENMAPGAWDLNLGLQDVWEEVKGFEYSWVLPDNFHANIATQETELVPFTFMDSNYELPVKVNSRPKFHKGLGPNTIHSVDGMVVRELTARCMMNSADIQEAFMNLNDRSVDSNNPNFVMATQLWKNYEETGFLSARIIPYLGKGTMGLVDPIEIAKLIRSLPNDTFDVISIHDCFRCHPNYGNQLRRQYNTIMADINDSNLLESLVRQISKKPLRVKKVNNIDRSLVMDSNYMLA